VTAFWGRMVRVRAGLAGALGLEWSSTDVSGRPEGMRLAANIKLTDAAEPDTATVQVWNPEAGALAILRSKNTSVMIEAGYLEGGPSLLFVGDVEPDGAASRRDGPDIIVEAKLADSRLAFHGARLYEEFAGPVRTSDLLRRLATAMGLPTPTLPQDMQDLTYGRGYAVSGLARRALDAICRDAGVRWLVQQGQMVVSKIGAPAIGVASVPVWVTPDTGLVGSPTREERGVGFVSLLNPMLRPRGLALLGAADLGGIYLIKAVEHRLDSAGGDFYSEVHAVTMEAAA